MLRKDENVKCERGSASVSEAGTAELDWFQRSFTDGGRNLRCQEGKVASCDTNDKEMVVTQ